MHQDKIVLPIRATYAKKKLDKYQRLRVCWKEFDYNLVQYMKVLVNEYDLFSNDWNLDYLLDQFAYPNLW